MTEERDTLNRGCFITGPFEQPFLNSWRQMRYILPIVSPFMRPLLTRNIPSSFLGRHGLGRSKSKAEEVSDAPERVSTVRKPPFKHSYFCMHVVFWPPLVSRMEACSW